MEKEIRNFTRGLESAVIRRNLEKMGWKDIEEDEGHHVFSTKRLDDGRLVKMVWNPVHGTEKDRYIVTAPATFDEASSIAEKLISVEYPHSDCWTAVQHVMGKHEDFVEITVRNAIMLTWVIENCFPIGSRFTVDHLSTGIGEGNDG